MPTSQRFHLSLFAVLFGLSFLSPPSIQAQDPCFSGFPTITGEVNYGTEWIPEWAISNPLKMAPNTCEPISLSGGTGPFAWSIQGSGFWFDEQHTMTEQITDTGTIDLCADAFACGTATIIVTDAFGVTVTGYVKSEIGYWYPLESEQCSVWQRDHCAFCNCDEYFEIGPYRYLNSWIGDKACQMTEETCGPYPGGSDLSTNQCYVVGFHPPETCVTFFWKQKWEWTCPP